MAKARDPQQYDSLVKLIWEYTDQFWIVLLIFFILVGCRELYQHTLGYLF